MTNVVPLQRASVMSHPPLVMRSTRFKEYVAMESFEMEWMIEGLWGARSHGIIAGEPKTRKSYLALDMGLSVATGTPCLGYFKVPHAGPVLLIQEEISDAELAKRMRWMAVQKGVSGDIEFLPDGTVLIEFPKDIPFSLVNRWQFDLTNPEHMTTLARRVRELGIVLVILDPLQLMLGRADENHASEVRVILQNLLELKESEGCGIMIVHHYHKASSTNPRNGGQRMLGSMAFHGWVESALYLEKPEAYVTRVEREFRNSEPLGGFDIEYIGEDSYEVMVTEDKMKKRTQLDEIEAYVSKHPDGVNIAQASKDLGITKDTVLRRSIKSTRIEIKDIQGKMGRPAKTLFFNPPK